MPISSIIEQPASNGLNAVYRPIVLKVKATNTDGSARPPVVYCDIYFGGIYYKTISKTQPLTINPGDTDWFFDIEDACQEVLIKQIGANGGASIIDATGLIKPAYCKFRSSGLDINGFIQYEGTAPVQATGTTSPIAGTGTQSNTFYILNSTLQHEHNQSLAAHLGYYKNGNWSAATFPLTHRLNGYSMCKTSSDYFPIVSDLVANCVRLHYRYKGTSTYLQDDSCGGGGGCVAVAISGSPNMPNGTVGVPYSYSFTVTGDTPFNLSGITKPSWLLISVSGHTVSFSGTPNASGTAIPVSFTITNCGGSAVFSDTFNVTASCVAVGIFGTPSLPNAVVNQPYSYTFNLTGTAPFNITSVVKPAWMSINVSGSSIVFGGTPSSTATGVTVSFTIRNCSNASTTPFSDTLDVTQATATLTIKYVPFGFNEFTANLSVTIDADVNIEKVFADGYDTPTCITGTASAQFNNQTPFVIAAGSTNNNKPPEQITGDWSTAVSYRIYNLIINTVALADGQVITIGSYQVTMIVDTVCTDL